MDLVNTTLFLFGTREEEINTRHFIQFDDLMRRIDFVNYEINEFTNDTKSRDPVELQDQARRLFRHCENILFLHKERDVNLSNLTFDMLGFEAGCDLREHIASMAGDSFELHVARELHYECVAIYDLFDANCLDMNLDRLFDKYHCAVDGLDELDVIVVYTHERKKAIAALYEVRSSCMTTIAIFGDRIDTRERDVLDSTFGNCDIVDMIVEYTNSLFDLSGYHDLLQLILQHTHGARTFEDYDSNLQDMEDCDYADVQMERIAEMENHGQMEVYDLYF